MTLMLVMLTAMTAWANSITTSGYVKVNINGSGTVTLTHSGGTDVPVTSGTSYNVSGAYTLNFVPSSGYEVNNVTFKNDLSLGATEDINVDRNGGSYTRQQIMGTDEYTVFFEEPGTVSFYTLTSDVNPLTFSVGGTTVSTAKEGDRVDITPSEPLTNGRWVLTSNDVSPITQDDATHFHFTMPGRNVLVVATFIGQAYPISDNSTHGHVNVSGGDENGELFGSETVTLTVVPDAGYEYVDGSLSATKSNTGEAIALTDQGNGTWTFTMPTNEVVVSATFTPNPAHFSVSGDEYTIHTAAGWDVFCDALQDNDTYNRFSGKTVKLGADIGTAQNPVTRMAGSSQHDFCGTFDGKGYTLTVNISSDNAHDYTAPFSYVSTVNNSPATICNLNVAGTVTATKDYAGGIVGCFWGTLSIENCTSSVTINTDNKHAAGFISRAAGDVTIRNCLSSCTINSSKEGDGTHAGFIGGTYDGKTFTIEGCAFTGSLLTTNGTTHCAGFMGYNSGTLTITNSLFAPQADNNAITDGATFARNWTMPDDANSYYTLALGTAQGKAACPATAAPVGDATHAIYSVSQITPYANGLTCGETFYYGGGDNVSVSYVDENGTNGSHAAIALDGTESNINEGWYFVGTDISHSGTIDCTNNVNIILADGKTMTVNSPNDGIYGKGSGPLTIYGQTLGTGTLSATASKSCIYHKHGNIVIRGGTVNATGTGTNSAGIDATGSVTITGGTVNATATSGGIAATGNVTITGGKVTATGNVAGIYSSDGYITITGGQVTATGDEAGIYSDDGNITLGWTSASDFIKASSYYLYNSNSSVKIASGKTLSDGTNTYDNQTASATLLALTNVTLTAPTYSVTANRATAEDTEYWSTFYHPAAGYTADENTTVYQAAVNTTTNKVELTAVPGREIPADKAVVLKSTQSAITLSRATTTQTLDGNELKGGSTVADGTVPYTLAAKDGKVGFYKFVGAALNPNKAHLEITAPAQSAPAFFGFEENTTAINEHELHESHELSGAWYSLDGRKLSGKPSAKGIYVRNGRKFIIK